MNCRGNEDVCVSMVTKTEVFINHRGNAGDPIPAGSWDKSCMFRSKLPQLLGDLEEFFDGQSDRCKEIKSSFVKVLNINNSNICFMC